MALNRIEPSSLIIPDWPAPDNVMAFSTTRQGGFSQQSFASLNLGLHVGDIPETVAANRRRLPNYAHAAWLNQVHGNRCCKLPLAPNDRSADASYTDSAGGMCCVMTADCLPLLICDRQGTCVAAVHGGWRGLAEGVIENTIQQMPAQPEQLLVWLGPAIGPAQFEVGGEVRDTFAAYPEAFRQKAEGKFLMDIYQVAREKLTQLGVLQIYGGEYCTYTQEERFFSHRRATHQGLSSSGRMASCIYLKAL